MQLSFYCNSYVTTQGLDRQNSGWSQEIKDYHFAIIIIQYDNNCSDRQHNCITCSYTGRLVRIYINSYCLAWLGHQSQFSPVLINSWSYQHRPNFLIRACLLTVTQHSSTWTNLDSHLARTGKPERGLPLAILFEKTVQSCPLEQRRIHRQEINHDWLSPQTIPQWREDEED